MAERARFLPSNTMHPVIHELTERHPALSICAEEIQRTADLLVGVFRAGGKLLLCGNGGSAADCDHMAAEFLKSFKHPRSLPPEIRERLGPEMASQLEGGLPAIPLPLFTGLLTAYQNDREGIHGFAQLTLSLGKPGDAFLGISTSGNAANVIAAAQTARALGLKVFGLTGETGGELRQHCHRCIRVPGTEVEHIQELHLPVYHALCKTVESIFFAE